MANERCLNCGNYVEPVDGRCPKCGSRMETRHKHEAEKRGGPGCIIVICILIAAAAFGIWRYAVSYNTRRYGMILNNTVYYLNECAGTAEVAGVKLNNVWYCAYTKTANEDADAFTRKEDGSFRDAGEAIGLLEENEEYGAGMRDAAEAIRNAEALMAQLSDPPKRYEQAYTDLQQLYADTAEFYGLVAARPETLEEYAPRFLELREKLAGEFNAIKAYLN